MYTLTCKSLLALTCCASASCTGKVHREFINDFAGGQSEDMIHKRLAGLVSRHNPLQGLATLLLMASSAPSSTSPGGTFSVIGGNHIHHHLGHRVPMTRANREVSEDIRHMPETMSFVGRREALGVSGMIAATALVGKAEMANADVPQQQLADAASLMLKQSSTTLLQRSIGEPVISGGRFPLTVGFGTCLIRPDNTQNLVDLAIQTGYRLFDTAQRYGNEEGLGKALKIAFKSGQLNRQDVFVTTKVWIKNMGYDATLKSVRESVAKLGSLDGGIDLVLIHWPGEFVRRGQDPFSNNARLRRETWEALEKLQSDGVVKQIGVSNFGERHLKELLGFAKVKPWVNQFEIHPYNQRERLVEMCQSEGIAVNAYSPLGGKGNKGQVTDQLLTDPVLVKIGDAHGKTAAEAILRWHLQRRITPIPKSSTKSRMSENYNVFDFELSEEEMSAIAKLEKSQFAIQDDEQIE
jgi:diketogulonate reductase-like aldo/keto reductase